MADLGVFERRPPRGFHDPDRLALELDHDPIRPAPLQEKRIEPICQRNFPQFSSRCFGVRDRDDSLREIDILPTLAGDLAPAHTGIEGDHDHGAEVALCDAEEGCFLGDGEDLAADAPLRRHLESGEWIRSDKLLVHCPIQDMAEDAQIPIDRRVFNHWVELFAFPSKRFRQRLRDAKRRSVREEP